jgi:hypothetical protein
VSVLQCDVNLALKFIATVAEVTQDEVRDVLHLSGAHGFEMRIIRQQRGNVKPPLAQLFLRQAE